MRTKGRLSKTEWDYIERNCNDMTAEEMADKLGRDIEAVRTYLQKIGKSNNKKAVLEVQAEYDLKERDFWKDIKSQFSEDEQKLFLYHWKRMIGQFRRDVLPTEELQIVDLIKLEILMNRALKDQKFHMDSVERLNAELMLLERVPLAERDKELYFSVQRQIANAGAAKESLSREFKELLNQKKQLFKDMKATREQRVQRLESDKKNFAGLVSRLLEDPEFYEEQGKLMEMMRMATLSAHDKLGQYHTYADGKVDRPILNEKTVMGDL